MTEMAHTQLSPDSYQLVYVNVNRWQRQINSVHCIDYEAQHSLKSEVVLPDHLVGDHNLQVLSIGFLNDGKDLVVSLIVVEYSSNVLWRRQTDNFGGKVWVEILKPPSVIDVRFTNLNGMINVMFLNATEGERRSSWNFILALEAFPWDCNESGACNIIYKEPVCVIKSRLSETFNFVVLQNSAVITLSTRNHRLTLCNGSEIENVALPSNVSQRLSIIASSPSANRMVALSRDSMEFQIYKTQQSGNLKYVDCIRIFRLYFSCSNFYTRQFISDLTHEHVLIN